MFEPSQKLLSSFVKAFQELLSKGSYHSLHLALLLGLDLHFDSVKKQKA